MRHVTLFGLALLLAACGQLKACGKTLTSPETAISYGLGADGFLKIQPYNTSLWVNGNDNGGSCLQRQLADRSLILAKDSGFQCGTITGWEFSGSPAAIAATYQVQLTYGPLSLTVPFDAPHDFTFACSNGIELWQLDGGIRWKPIPLVSCMAVPSGTPGTSEVIRGLTWCGATWISLTNGKTTFTRRITSGFSSCIDVLDNGLSVTMEAGWVTGFEVAVKGKAPPGPGRYQATETIEVQE